MRASSNYNSTALDAARRATEREDSTMRGTRWQHAAAGLGLAAFMGTTGLAQRQFQFFAHFADGAGKPVAALTADDIAVQEGGVNGKVLTLEPIAWPIKVAILIDNGTGSGDRLNHTREGVRALIKGLPAGVEASLQTTAPQPRFLVRPTTDKGALLSGVDLITPDSAAGRFVEGLIETVSRFDKERGDKEKANFFPVVVIVGSLTAEGSSIRDRDVQRMQQQLMAQAVTVHAVMVGPTNQSGTTNVSNAIQIGIDATKRTGGRYESIAATTRLTTLLPEIGTQVAQAHERQRAQYRVTFERPEGKSGPVGEIGLAAGRGMSAKLTLDGHMP
jgi:hypothetical protein